MAELKTQATTASVSDFIANISDPAQKADAKAVLEMMERLSGHKPKMWGSSIVGFVDVHLRYDSGRELDWFQIGFAPRKGNLVLYGIGYVVNSNPSLLKELGKCTTGKGCVYLKKLSDVDLEALEKIMTTALTLHHEIKL